MGPRLGCTIKARAKLAPKTCSFDAVNATTTGLGKFGKCKTKFAKPRKVPKKQKQILASASNRMQMF
jgi:ribosomal protein L37AE/L43A